MGHGETGGNVSAPVVRDFFKIALADQPPIPFRAPPGIKLVRVNLKTGLPAASGDPKAIMEAFKPTQDPLGAVATDEAGSQEGLVPEEYGQAGPTPPIPGVVPGGNAGSPPPPSTVSQKPLAALRSKGTITAGRNTIVAVRLGRCWGVYSAGSELNLRFGSLADIASRPRHVRFTPQSGHSSRGLHVRLVP